MIKLITVLVIASLGFTAVQSQEELKCGTCLAENEVLCVSETSYYFCFDGETVGDEIQCAGDTVCSNAEEVCVPKTQISETVKNVCGDASIGGCGKCITGNKYTCVSPTQAARCVKNEIAGVINCKADEICIADVEVGSVCVPQCAAAYVSRSFRNLASSRITYIGSLQLGKNATCNEDAEYTTPTPAPSTTPSPDERSRICNEASEGVTGLFFYTYADGSCRNGVYCQRPSLSSTDWTTFYRPCSAPTPYFNTLLKYCVETKPTNCPVPTTTVAPVTDSTLAPVSPTTVPSTTAAPVPSTTAAPVPSTTAAPVPSTTAAPVPSTTAAPVPSTTATPGSSSSSAPE
ncbi:PREDICTED: LOW QUALITY PROTEIN: mucin-5AC-like [Drosophila arizonae]|uniref:LOW QUALITY PROTEIN: mucin-5AC-like n=1 Tax=Drosophila arizonae TaxID=7263 RepID=A0ABM1P0A3_DROAR|nr:PREDICTED: LOW QUALITY PROTEIN: mucin-5AC-like [Drosophila arizonae]